MLLETLEETPRLNAEGLIITYFGRLQVDLSAAMVEICEIPKGLFNIEPHSLYQNPNYSLL